MFIKKPLTSSARDLRNLLKFSHLGEKDTQKDLHFNATFHSLFTASQNTFRASEVILQHHHYCNVGNTAASYAKQKQSGFTLDNIFWFGGVG